MRENGRKHKRLAIAVSVSAAVVLFAALGGAGLAQTALAPAQGLVAQDQSNKKVVICHKGKNTISISVNALPAHLRHGDTEDECAVAAQATDTTGSAKVKKLEKEQSTESAEESEKPTENGTTGASAGGDTKLKPAKDKSKKKAAPTSAQTNVVPATALKPKKQKPSTWKGGSAFPPGLGGGSPPGHANGKGSGKNK